MSSTQSAVLEKVNLMNGAKRPSTQAPTASVTDFLELARVYRPAGALGFHIPLMIGVFISIVTEAPQPKYLEALAFFVQLSLASFFQRSSACAWNDAADYEFDKQVTRTRNRPIPRGSVSPVAARIYAAALAVVWVLLVWPSGSQALWTLVPNFLFNVAYPFAKRVTYYPQVWLGFTTCWNVLTGYMMTTQYDTRTALQDPQILYSLGFLMLAEAAFNGFYDTIYAYQDFADDQKAGVRSVTLRWAENGKVALVVMMGLEMLFLVLAGFALDAGSFYFLFSCVGSAGVAVAALVSCDLAKPDDCAAWFKKSILYGAIAQCSGLLLDYVQRL